MLAKLDITERARPQDGRIRIQYRDMVVDLRVSSLPTQFGEKVTLRILNASAAPNGLDDLHLSDRDLRCIRYAITRPQGMILVTGPTGSGKTTTLYSMLAELISPTRNIVTIENPIEYQMPGVNQVEINERRGLTFAGTLRSILRQDPDVILVGEIRDRDRRDRRPRRADRASGAEYAAHQRLGGQHHAPARSGRRAVRARPGAELDHRAAAGPPPVRVVPRQLQAGRAELAALRHRADFAHLGRACASTAISSSEDSINEIRFFRSTGCQLRMTGSRGRVGISRSSRSPTRSDR